mmetsp:Transcript_60756/g.159778  ORF Transcript_60756/g.159778 Transcript_60756/m.159778 type:complete len:235 (-) Transcript_60756:3-707(-)
MRVVVERRVRAVPGEHVAGAVLDADHREVFERVVVGLVEDAAVAGQKVDGRGALHLRFCASVPLPAGTALVEVDEDLVQVARGHPEVVVVAPEALRLVRRGELHVRGHLHVRDRAPAPANATWQVDAQLAERMPLLRKLLQAQRSLALGREPHVVESLDLPFGVQKHDIIRVLSVLTLVSLCEDGGLCAPHARRKARQPNGECHVSTVAHCDEIVVFPGGDLVCGCCSEQEPRA